MISREEAIELLENLKVCKQAHILFNIEKEAVDMAIEALKEKKRALQLKSKVRNIDGWQNIVNEVARLEAEERGGNGMRLIDADTLIEAMEERKKIWLSKYEYNDAIRKVKEAPTIEAYTFEQVQDLVALNKKLSEQWEYLKEHITELRDANSYATQYGTCQFILNLMKTIEKEGKKE